MFFCVHSQISSNGYTLELKSTVRKQLPCLCLCILADLNRIQTAASPGLWKKPPRFGKAFRSEIPVILVVSTPRFTKIVRSQCPSRGNVLMYLCLSEHYLSWGMGKRPSLLLAGERAVYKKLLVGKPPHCCPNANDSKMQLEHKHLNSECSSSTSWGI